MRYSVAIRTLGKSPETLRRELLSISRQTIKPDRVVVYIAKGYPKPDFDIMGEIYVEVKKGMVSQRAHEYKEIDSDLILMLDDDVELAENSVEIMTKQLIMHDADCVAADTFQNHQMSGESKVWALMTNFVSQKDRSDWAFKLHRNGSFSYISNPTEDCYPSQSAAGPASLWRKDVFLNLDYKSELWMDQFDFSYGDDELIFYKLFINGGRLFVSFSSGVKNLDAKSASSVFKADSKKFYIRAKSNYMRWYRMLYETRQNSKDRSVTALLFGIKATWGALLHVPLSIVKLSISPITMYLKGMRDGIAFVKSGDYKTLHPYKLHNVNLRGQ